MAAAYAAHAQRFIRRTPRPAVTMPSLRQDGLAGASRIVGTRLLRPAGLLHSGRTAGRSKLAKTSGVRKAVISWICAPRKVSTSTARGVKVWVLSSQA